MSLKIRLARHGAKKKPYYRVVIADARAPRDGRYIERVGSYNPMLGKDDENRVILDADKIKEWLAKGARPTERVARFLGAAGLWEWKHGNNPIKGKPGAKALEMIESQKERVEARKVADEEAKEAATEAAAAAKVAEAEAKEAEKAAAAEAKEAAKAAAEAAPAEDVKAEAPAEAKEADAAPAEETLAETVAEEKEPRHIKYFETVKKYDADADEDIVKKIVNHLGIALNSKDASLVACSDETERNTVRDSWLKKKLEIEGDDAALDAKVMAVCETMKDDKNKCRVTFYYLLAKTEDKLAAL